MDILAEKQDRFELIQDFIPGWQEARDRADRDGRMNALLNKDAENKFAMIDKLLDEVIELNLLADAQV